MQVLLRRSASKQKWVLYFLFTARMTANQSSWQQWHSNFIMACASTSRSSDDKCRKNITKFCKNNIIKENAWAKISAEVGVNSMYYRMQVGVYCKNFPVQWWHLHCIALPSFLGRNGKCLCCITNFCIPEFFNAMFQKLRKSLRCVTYCWKSGFRKKIIAATNTTEIKPKKTFRIKLQNIFQWTPQHSTMKACSNAF